MTKKTVLFTGYKEDSGGAAIAASRLYDAIRKYSNYEAKYWSWEPALEHDRERISTNRLQTVKYFGSRTLEKMTNKVFKKSNQIFSLNFFGALSHRDLNKTNCDIANIHWINNNFVGLSGFEKFRRPVVWTLHDQWLTTGGCHYPEENCEQFISKNCSQCPIFAYRPLNLPQRMKIIKNRLIENHPNQFIVTPSNWLREEVTRSLNIEASRIKTIHNGIDFDEFKLINRENSRIQLGLDTRKKYLLFAAMDPTDKRKGLDLLSIALKMSEVDRDLVLLTIGEMDYQFPFEVISFGKVRSPGKLNQIYAAADLFVAPSRQDNLPNTVLESLASGTPCVAFNIGGMKEMISVENGYLVQPFDTIELCYAINSTIARNIQQEAIRENAKRKFDIKHVAKIYSNTMDEILSINLETRHH